MPDGRRRSGVAQFVVNGVRDQHAIKQLTEQVSVTDEDEVMEWSGVRDGQHVGSEADPVQVLLLAFELGNRHALDHAARLEEAVEFTAGREAKQAAQFGTPQPAGAVLLQRERLQRPASQVGAGV